MVRPNSTAHWCRADYKKIDRLKNFSAVDAFCDEEGNAGTTTINIVIRYKELADLEKIIELGFKEGFTAALGNLDQYLESQGKPGVGYVANELFSWGYVSAE